MLDLSVGYLHNLYGLRTCLEVSFHFHQNTALNIIHNQLNRLCFLSWQLTFLFRSTLKLVADALNDFPLLTKGQIGQLLHLFIPGFSLCGLSGGGGGILVLIILSLILGGLL